MPSLRHPRWAAASRAVLLALLCTAPAARADDVTPGAGPPLPDEGVATASELPPERPATDDDAPPASPPAPAETAVADPSPEATVDAPRPAPLVSPPPVSAEGARRRIAVLDLRPKGVPDALAATLSAVIAGRIAATEVFDVVTEEDIRQLVDWDAMKASLSSCDDPSCLTDLGPAFGARYVVTGTAGQAGDGLVVGVALFDLETASVVARESVSGAPSHGLVDALVQATDAVVRPLLAALKGTLYVEVSEAGATVLVDGVAIGETPAPPRSLPSGPHRVEVAKDGFLTATRDLVVDPDDTLAIRVVLSPSTDYLDRYRATAWAFRGTALALVGVGATSLFTGGALYAANLFIVEGIAAEQGKSGTRDAIRVTPEDAFTIQTLRVAGVGLALAAPFFVGGAVVAWVLGDDPFKYDALVVAE